jgi:hypothetical protein
MHTAHVYTAHVYTSQAWSFEAHDRERAPSHASHLVKKRMLPTPRENGQSLIGDKWNKVKYRKQVDLTLIISPFSFNI